MIEDILRRIVREEVRAALADAIQAPGRALTTAQVAEALGVVPRVVVDMIRDGELRAWRLHGDRGDWRVNSRDLETFLAERAEAA
jgi:excisionase family DNA binding protein